MPEMLKGVGCVSGGGWVCLVQLEHRRHVDRGSIVARGRVWGGGPLPRKFAHFKHSKFHDFLIFSTFGGTKFHDPMNV